MQFNVTEHEIVETHSREKKQERKKKSAKKEKDSASDVLGEQENIILFLCSSSPYMKRIFFSQKKNT